MTTLTRWTLFGILLLAVPLHAATTCLVGDAELGDRRALAAFHDALDAACPCADFTGGARNRRAYQKCARPLLASALRDTLRAPCRRDAWYLVRGAPCGSSKVACGEVREPSGPPTCRIVAPDRCRSRDETQATACESATSCADVVDWTAGTCLDPRAPGPYGAGVRVIAFTKKSVTQPDQDRVLETAIWYPTTAGAGPIDETYAAVQDAPLATAGAPYPLLMFSHGSCGYPSQSTFFTALLATHGFIVAAPPHPGNTLFDYPACGSAAAQVASYFERPKDIIFVLDQMLAASADATSPFHGAVDPARLGMMGHSFGGLTTYLVVDQDTRFRVAVPMAPAVTGPLPLTLPIPSFTMLGAIDSVINDQDAIGVFETAVLPRSLLLVGHAGHYAFSDGCFPSPDCNPPTTLTQDEAHALVRRWLIPYLEVNLAGDERYRPLLDPPLAGAGVTYETNP